MSRLVRALEGPYKANPRLALDAAPRPQPGARWVGAFAGPTAGGGGPRK